MAVRHAILGLLHERSGHAYEITARFNHRFGEVWALNRGQTHATLAVLERECLITKGPTSPTTSSKIRAVYSITDAGRAEFQRWMVTAEAEPPRPIRTSLMMKLAFATRQQAPLLISLVAQREEEVSTALAGHVESAHRALGHDSDGNVWARLLPELARGAEISRLEAELEWLAGVRACLEAYLERGTVPSDLRVGLLGGTHSATLDARRAS